MAKILVVDDHPDVRDVLGQMLQMHGHTVSTAETGERALESIEQSLPDVVVIDQNLPGISGMDLLRYVRNTPRLSNLKVVLCSADDSEREAAASAGACGFWLKGSAGIFDAVAQLNDDLNEPVLSKPDPDRVV
jgi:CheY-like chemotaxis protein